MHFVLLNICNFSTTIFLFVVVGCVQGDSWDHHERRETGPKGWSIKYPACEGSRQSPVDVDRGALRFSSSLTTFELPGYETIPRSAHWEMVNTGHLLQIQLNGDYQMREGGLTGSYRAIQMDFRWGSSERDGSEHSINGTHFPLELQILHYNTKYGSYDEALQQSDGLAAFSFLFRAKDHDNPIYAQIINKLDKVAYQGQQVTLRPVPLLSLLPINLNNYYRYDGSLTQPPCNENVIWTVFTDTIEISIRQLNLIRTSLRSNYPSTNGKPASSSDIRILTNQRPVQSLNGRIIYSSNIIDATFWTAPLSPISITLAVLLGFVLLFLILGRQQDGYEIVDGGAYHGDGYLQFTPGGDYDNDIDAHLD